MSLKFQSLPNCNCSCWTSTFPLCENCNLFRWLHSPIRLVTSSIVSNVTCLPLNLISLSIGNVLTILICFHSSFASSQWCESIHNCLMLGCVVAKPIISSHMEDVSAKTWVSQVVSKWTEKMEFYSGDSKQEIRFLYHCIRMKFPIFSNCSNKLVSNQWDSLAQHFLIDSLSSCSSRSKDLLIFCILSQSSIS